MDDYIYYEQSPNILFTPKIYKVLLIITLIGNHLSQKQVDLLGQYIGLVLIPRLNRADQFFANRQYRKAIIAQKSVIRALYREIGKTECSEGEHQLKSWIKRVDNIIQNPMETGGVSSTSKQYREDSKIGFLAKKLYEELDWEIWGKLHELGYFAGRGGYGPRLKDIDMSISDEI